MSTPTQHRYQPPADATHLLLVRHGATVGDLSGADVPRWNGQADPPLHPEGVAEAVLAADYLRHQGLVALYTSPLQRTRATAAPLAAHTGLTPIETADLREVFLGAADGGDLSVAGPYGELARRVYKEERWELFPGAETAVDFTARVRRGIDAIAAAHVGGVVAVVTHGGVIGEAVAIATGSRAHAFVNADNASITHLVTRRGRWTVRAFNVTTHLRPTLA